MEGGERVREWFRGRTLIWHFVDFVVIPPVDLEEDLLALIQTVEFGISQSEVPNVLINHHLLLVLPQVLDVLEEVAFLDVEIIGGAPSSPLYCLQ
jgi:hypothetical protein